MYIRLITILMGLLMWLPASALDKTGEPVRLDEKAAAKAAKTITANYTDWQTVTLSGKLELDRLPFSPSVKIFMQRGKRIVVSLRVPLLGEVGTLDVNDHEFTIVNKMKKTYCREDFSELMADLPVGLADLQDLFLGRIFLPGEGTLSMSNWQKAEYFTDKGVGGWMVMPVEQPVEYDVSCGYVTLADGRTQTIFVSTLDASSQAGALYEYDGDRTDIDMTIRYNGKDREFGFSIRETQWGSRALSPAKVDGSYQKLSLSDFFRKL